MAGEGLPDWGHYIDALRTIDSAVLGTVPPPGDARTRQETWQGMFASLASGFIAYAAADPDYPELVSITNAALNVLAPNPDFMYTWTLIDSAGSYRIRGFRNTVRFVELGFLKGLYALPHNQGAVGLLDLDSLALGPDGAVDLLVSPVRPEGYGGDWFRMPAGADNLLVRSVAYDWINERDAVLTIERLDVPASRPRRSAEEIARRLSSLPQWVALSHERHHGRLAELHRKGLRNKLQVYDYRSWGAADGQVYLEGLFDIAEDEALILETEIPQDCRYWGFMLADGQLGSIDWIHRQSSLNGFQARLDDDGRFRCVIAMSDPGVPNWLDTGGFGQGMIWGRWNGGDSSPMPSISKVDLGSVRDHLPGNTPAISPERRDALLRERRYGAQLRRRW